MVQPGLEISNQAFEFVAFSLIALESENFSLQLWNINFNIIITFIIITIITIMAIITF